MKEIKVSIWWRIKDWWKEPTNNPLCRLLGHKKYEPRRIFTNDYREDGIRRKTDHRFCRRCRFWEALNKNGEWVDISAKY